MNRRRLLKLTSVALAGAAALPALPRAQTTGAAPGLWSVWDNFFARARFVSLSHVLTPDTPVWKGFPTTTKFQQGTGPGDAAEAPLPYNDKRLVWNEAKGVRERTAPCDKPKGKLSFN